MATLKFNNVHQGKYVFKEIRNAVIFVDFDAKKFYISAKKIVTCTEDEMNKILSDPQTKP